MRHALCGVAYLAVTSEAEIEELLVVLRRHLEVGLREHAGVSTDWRTVKILRLKTVYLGERKGTA